MKKIGFETHFYTQEYIAAMYQNKGYPRFSADDKTKDRRLWYNAEVGQPFADFLLSALVNLGEERLKRIDTCGVDVQTLVRTQKRQKIFFLYFLHINSQGESRCEIILTYIRSLW